MIRAFKIFAIVTFFILSAGIPAWGYEHQGFKNRAFERLKKEVWYSGIESASSRENIFKTSDKLRESFSSPSKEDSNVNWKESYPEELVYPLMELSYVEGR